MDLHHIYKYYGVPHYMKIDIEGSDTYVLESLRHLDRRPQYISFESNKNSFEDLKTEVASLVQLGYSKFRAVQQATIPGGRIITRTINGEMLEYVFEEHASGAFGEDLSQQWLVPDVLLQEYRDIFRRYRAFGDGALFTRIPYRFKRPLEIAYKLGTGYRGPLPGWFDTHASL